MCDNCDKCFHVTTKLTTIFKCSLCEYSSIKKCNLDRHTKAKHDKINNLACAQCLYKTGRTDHFQRHSTICVGSKTMYSGLELRTIEELAKLGFVENIDFIFNKSFNDLTEYSKKSLRPDIRFINHKIIIECDGEQHHKPTKFFKQTNEEMNTCFNKLQEHDNLKNEFCKEFQYKMLRIKYNQIKQIKDILTTELSHILNNIEMPIS